jgi:heat shock protein HslJ
MKRILISLGSCAGFFILAGFLTGCASQDGGDLTGQVWGLTELGSQAILPDTGVTAQFNTDGTLSGSAGCNQYHGTYTTSGSSITIATPLATTLMACDGPVMDQENAYLTALGAAKTFTIRGEQLTLADANKTTVLTYQAQSQDLTGTSWEVIGFNNGKEAVVSVLLDTTISADFGRDGTLSGSAGCNDYNGSYTVNGDQIKIGPLASTQKFCGDPPGIMDQEAQYLAALEAAATYQIEGNVLEFRTQDGTLAVQFNKE